MKRSKIDQAKFEEYLGEFGNEEEALDHLLRWKCLTDLYYLGSDILGMGKAMRMGSLLLDPKYHKWVADTLRKDEHSLIQLPRGHLKTAWLLVLIVQDLLRNPNERIHLYSITQDFVEGHLALIKQHLETPLLNHLFPDTVPPREEWETDIKNKLVMRRHKVPGELIMGNQVEVYGVGNTITGRRATKQYFDDLIDKDTVRTPGQLEKTRQWFSGAMPVMEPGGVRKMIGTPYHYNDLYYTIKKDEIFDKAYMRPIKNARGKFECKWWTAKRLKQVTRGMLDYDINCQYHLNPLPIDAMAFPPPQPKYKELPDEELIWYIAVDPAATTEKYSDETAIIVAAISKEGMVYITREFHGKWPGNETAKKIIGLAAEIQPRKIGIEFGLQEHLRYIIDNEKSNWEEVNKRPLPIYIEPIRISNRMNKFDRVNWTLGSFVKQGQVKIHESCVDLMAQMDRFNKNYTGKDDLVDAASMIFRVADTFSYRNYTEEIPEWEPIDYFTIDGLAKEKPKVRERFIS